MPREHPEISQADFICREVEESLNRLDVETIDLYQIPPGPPNPDSPDLEEGGRFLSALQREGKVRWIGVSNFDVRQMRRAQNIASITSLQPPYSLINRGIEKDILPYCLREDVGVIVYSPMASGLLTGAMTRERIAGLPQDDWRSRDPEFSEPRLSRNLALTDRLRDIAKRYDRSPGQVAVAWTLRNRAVTGAIVGARNAQQVDGVMQAAELVLTDQDIIEIEEVAAEFAA